MLQKIVLNLSDLKIAFKIFKLYGFKIIFTLVKLNYGFFSIRNILLINKVIKFLTTIRFVKVNNEFSISDEEYDYNTAGFGHKSPINPCHDSTGFIQTGT